MKEIKQLKKVKKIELEILREFDAFCRANNLSYFLGYGTLLGAIRHKGFIPWDDDIDVVMPRKDYDAFLEKYNSDIYTVMSAKQKNYYYPFAKMCDKRTLLVEDVTKKIEMGIYIDIFPLDYANKDKRIHKKNNRRIVFYNSLLKHKYSSLNMRRSSLKRILLPIVKVLLLPISFNKLGLRLDYLSKNESVAPTDKIGCLVEDSKQDIVFETTNIFPLCEVEFEGFSFFAPKDSDYYLRLLYGNYMELPPVDKRVNKHSFRAFEKND